MRRASLASLKMEMRKGRVTGLSVALSNTAWYIRASMNTWPNRTLFKWPRARGRGRSRGREGGWGARHGAGRELGVGGFEA